MSPVTRASGKHHVVLARYARNRRLADACYQWAFSAITTSPGARTFYDARRAAGDTHHLHGCLRHHTLYDEHRLGPPTTTRRLTTTTRGMSNRWV